MIDLEGVACVADVGRVQALRRGSAPALTFEGRTTTFAEVDSMASRFANALIASGVGTQERVGYLSKNTDHFLPFLLGACKARLTLAPFNFRLAPPEIARLIEDSRTRILIVGPDVVELAEAAVASLPAKPRLIGLGFDRQGFERHDVCASSSDPRLEADSDDDVVQLYTSGTTGLPKGVRLTNRNYCAVFDLAGASGGLEYEVGDTVLAAMPFFHVAGVNIALIAMASGARSAVVRDVIPDLILDLIERERVNHAFLAPAIILMLMQSAKIASADLSSMKTLSYGASPISEDLLARANARFRCDFVQFYGMTETTGAGTFLAERGSRSGPRQAPLLRRRLARRRGEDRQCRRRRSAARRGRGSPHPRLRGDEGLLDEGRRHRRLGARRLDAHRRRRLHGRGRLCIHF